MHSGRLPRIDHWVLIFLTDALPLFFAEWTEARERTIYYNHMSHAAPPSIHPVIPRSRVPPLTAAQPTLPQPAVTVATLKPANVQDAMARAEKWAEKAFALQPAQTSELLPPSKREPLLEQTVSHTTLNRRVTQELTVSDDGDASCVRGTMECEAAEDDEEEEDRTDMDDSLVSMVVMASRSRSTSASSLAFSDCALDSSAILVTLDSLIGSVPATPSTNSSRSHDIPFDFPSDNSPPAASPSSEDGVEQASAMLEVHKAMDVGVGRYRLARWLLLRLDDGKASGSEKSPAQRKNRYDV
ncbi:hypothetical protein DFH06DRAFT_1433442 [Mycena polygramma]|nr:hypothetical protein DFH06DRAFT_1433442 [Mycena polygramma]